MNKLQLLMGELKRSWGINNLKRKYEIAETLHFSQMALSRRRARKAKMEMERGGNPLDLWSVTFHVYVMVMVTSANICQPSLVSFSNVSWQDLVAAKRRVSIFDKLRKNSKGVSGQGRCFYQMSF